MKSQIHAGGRGKGRFAGTDVGGVIVTNAAEAGSVAKKMLGNVLVTKQSGPEGRRVGRVLVEEGMQIVTEYYLALLLDRAVQAPVFIASAEGGTEIEEVAAADPAAIHRLTVSPITGYQPWMGRKLGFALGIKPELVGAFAKTVRRRCTPRSWPNRRVDGRDQPADADRRRPPARARRQGQPSTTTRSTGTPRFSSCAISPRKTRSRSKRRSSASTTSSSTATSPAWSTARGSRWGRWTSSSTTAGRPANFLDVGGGATQEMVTNAFRILLADPHVKAVLDQHLRRDHALRHRGGRRRRRGAGTSASRCRSSCASKGPTSSRARDPEEPRASRSAWPTACATRPRRSSPPRRGGSDGGPGRWRDTRLLVQGITGREGAFHTKQSVEYGTKVVAGVTPGKGGQTHEGIPGLRHGRGRGRRDRGERERDLRAAAVRRGRDPRSRGGRTSRSSSRSPRGSPRST